MIGTRLKEVCGKDKKFKTLKELAECVGVSSNMLYLTLQSKKSLSLKTLQKLVHNTGVSSNYLLGITSIKNISVFKTNKGIPFKYELNTKFLNPDSNDLVCKIIEDIRELENYHGRKLNNQFRYVDSLKINDGIFNGERLKVVMEATGYTSTSLAIILQCSKNTIDG